jgi:hypothetical protein
MKKYCSYLLTVLLAVSTGCATSKPKTATTTTATIGWDVKCTEFRTSLYKACYGPGWYPRTDRKAGEYDFYQMTVERNEGEGRWMKLYNTRIPLQKLSKEVLTKPALNTVEINDATNMIIFLVGDKTYRYCIKK